MIDTWVQYGGIGVAGLALFTLMAFVKLWVAQVDKMGDAMKANSESMMKLTIAIDCSTQASQKVVDLVNERLLRDFRKLKKGQEE